MEPVRDERSFAEAGRSRHQRELVVQAGVEPLQQRGSRNKRRMQPGRRELGVQQVGLVRKAYMLYCRHGVEDDDEMPRNVAMAQPVYDRAVNLTAGSASSFGAPLPCRVIFW
jgi:hypothetical protein